VIGVVAEAAHANMDYHKYWMRAREIITELSRPSRDKAEWMLLDAGYRQLGRGNSGGAVFQKPGAPYVLKIFDARDKAYMTFVEAASAFHNPHFPKFFGSLVKLTPDYYAVRTELLSPTSGRVDEITLIDKYIIQMRDYGSVYDEVYQYMADNPEMKMAADIVVSLLKSHKSQFFCDVHAANVMSRGSTLVLSDPIAVH